MNEASHQFLKDLDKSRVERDNRNAAKKAPDNCRRQPEGRAQRGNFIEEHGGKLGNLSVCGREKSARRKRQFCLSKRARRVSTGDRARQSNPTTWRLAAMNMAIRGIDFTALRVSAFSRCEVTLQSVREAKDHFGNEPANSFTSDQHPDPRADYVMANPPFNISEWRDAKLEGDPRWSRSEAETAPLNFSSVDRGIYGTPPKGNANFAWIQHMLHHLAPHGSMALLLANGSMSSGSGGEGDIRRALIEAGSN